MAKATRGRNSKAPAASGKSDKPYGLSKLGLQNLGKVYLAIYVRVMLIVLLKYFLLKKLINLIYLIL